MPARFVAHTTQLAGVQKRKGKGKGKGEVKKDAFQPLIDEEKNDIASYELELVQSEVTQVRSTLPPAPIVNQAELAAARQPITIAAASARCRPNGVCCPVEITKPGTSSHSRKGVCTWLPPRATIA
jgi:hypothetical protein